MAAVTPNRSRLDEPHSVYGPPGWGRTPRMARRGSLLRALRHVRSQLSLKPFRVDILIIVGYLVITRIGSLAAAKWGIRIGPVPLFLTDMTLIALLAVSMVKRPGQVLFWGTAGRAAGVAGQTTWILCVAAVIYFAFAFPVYHIFALRDLAIFIYSMFFALTYFAVDSRAWAQRITRYFVYSGLALGILVLFQFATGVTIGFVGTIDRTVMGRNIAFIGSDDFGGILAASTMGLVAYGLLEREGRWFHLIAAALCFFAMASTGTRSAIVAVAAAGFASFLLLSNRYRLPFVALGILFGVAVVGGAALPDSVPGARALHNFYVGIVSATGGSTDPNTAFRIERWKDAYRTFLAHPFFGVGFGRHILHQVYIGSWDAGLFNLGMPHNTYLYLLARSGLLGFGLVAIAMVWGMWKLAVAVRRYRLPDDLAAMNALVAMAVFGAFVLFFERPMTNAGFWMMLAVGVRLAETARGAAAARTARTKPVVAAEIRRQAVLATMAPYAALRH